MGFLDFTKLSFALSSLAQPFDQMGSVPEHVFVILSQRKAYAGRFQKETEQVRGQNGRPKGFCSPGLKSSSLQFLPLPNEGKLFPKCFKKTNVA